MDSLIESLGEHHTLLWLAGGYFGMVAVERVWRAWSDARKPGAPRYDDRDALCSMGLNLMNSLLMLGLAILVPLAVYVWVYESFRLTTLESLWVSVPVAFVLHELGYYLDHRLGHRVGLLWAFHAIHHSSNEFNHSTAARGFLLDGQLKVVGAVAAAFLGVPPVVYVAVTVLKLVFGIWNHASWVGHLGWLERVLMTPLNHKIHHANQPQYIDRNYGQVLMIWDKMFGSHAEHGEPPTVGLVNPVYDNNPLTAQFAGLRQLGAKMAGAERWQDKLAYLWRPPEWSHDGSCVSDCPKYAATDAGLVAGDA